jgi:hypothetical protein
MCARYAGTKRNRGGYDRAYRQSSRDAYYTPFPIAGRLAVYARRTGVRRVLDFACGDGSLLAAAEQRWPAAILIGNDRSRKALTDMRVRCPRVRAYRLNVLKVAANAHLITRYRNSWKPDVVLLNPPFSSRTRHRWPIAVGQELTGFVSQSAVFLLLGAQLIEPGSEMIAVMPFAFLASSRDKVARELLQGLGDIHVVERLPRNAFNGCRAESVILRFIRRRSQPSRFYAPEIEIANQYSAIHLVSAVVRGNVRVHETDLCSRPRRRFLHTTGIRDGVARPVLRALPAGARSVRGHVVLLPRVGMVRSTKIVACSFKSRVALSDCLYALSTKSVNDSTRLRSLLVTNWERIRAEYVGTGAPHLRSDALMRVLAEIALKSSLNSRGPAKTRNAG